MKYSLDEIKEMLKEPSFDPDDWSYLCMKDEDALDEICFIVEQAIKHHEKLSNADDGEGF